MREKIECAMRLAAVGEDGTVDDFTQDAMFKAREGWRVAHDDWSGFFGPQTTGPIPLGAGPT